MVKSLLSLLDERKLDHFALNINEDVLSVEGGGGSAEFYQKNVVLLSPVGKARLELSVEKMKQSEKRC